MITNNNEDNIDDYEMKDEYDFSNAIKNPWAEELRQHAEINVSKEVAEFFGEQSKQLGIPYLAVINMYLTDCAKNHRSVNVTWS